MNERQTKQQKTSRLKQKYIQSMTKTQNMLQVANVTNTVALVQIQTIKIVLNNLSAIVTYMAS